MTYSFELISTAPHPGRNQARADRGPRHARHDDSLQDVGSKSRPDAPGGRQSQVFRRQGQQQADRKRHRSPEVTQTLQSVVDAGRSNGSRSSTPTLRRAKMQVRRSSDDWPRNHRPSDDFRLLTVLSAAGFMSRTPQSSRLSRSSPKRCNLVRDVGKKNGAGPRVCLNIGGVDRTRTRQPRRDKHRQHCAPRTRPNKLWPCTRAAHARKGHVQFFAMESMRLRAAVASR